MTQEQMIGKYMDQRELSLSRLMMSEGISPHAGKVLIQLIGEATNQLRPLAAAQGLPVSKVQGWLAAVLRHQAETQSKAAQQFGRENVEAWAGRRRAEL